MDLLYNELYCIEEKVYDKIDSKSATNQKLYNKSATNPQQIWRLQQIHNMSTCRDVVQQIDAYNKCTRNLQQIEQLYYKILQLVVQKIHN